MTTKEIPSRPVQPNKALPKPSEGSSYKIPRKDQRPSDRDDEIQIKKKVNTDSGSMVNMIENYSNDMMRHNQNMNMGYDRGMRTSNMNQMNTDNYSNPQMNYGRYNQSIDIDPEFSDDDSNIPIQKTNRNLYGNPAQNLNQMNDLPNNRGYNAGGQPQQQQHQHQQQQQPNAGTIPSTQGSKAADILNLVTKLKQKTTPTTVNDPRQNAEQKQRTEQHVHHEKPKNLELIPSLSNRKSSEFYDQAPSLLFKSLLRMIKLGLFQTIKKKYNRERKSLNDFSRTNIMSIVDTLYKDIPYQCTTCALRFTHSTLLSKHLDWHFKTNREYKNKKENMKPRQPLLSIDGWLREEGSNRPEIANEEKGKEDFVFENYVLSDGDSKQCKACGDIFKEIWDKEKESWVLDGAVKAKYEGSTEEEDAKLKKKKDIFDLMHFKCYKLVLGSESAKN